MSTIQITKASGVSQIVVTPKAARKLEIRLAGTQGPANELSIGTVTDGPNANATITGQAPSQTLNLVLPQSQVEGPPGPPNELTIGTVTEGPADASITGDAPSQTLNLTIPKGSTGNAATIAVGTVTTVGPSDPATVTNVGTSSAAVLDFEIPHGADGTDGALWYAGASDPSSGTGDNGDFYLQTAAGSIGIIGDVWEKAAGSWSVVGNIRGASGSGSGDVTAAANIADGAIVVGDGGGKGVKAHASGAPGDAAFKDTGTGSGDVAAGNHGHDDATTSDPGFMSASDKSKLDGIASGATANAGTVTSVGLSVPTGLSISGSPITTSGTLGVTWTAGYQGYTSAEASKLSGIETSADVTDAGNVGSSIHGASAKTTPVDADTVPLIDSAASNVLKKVTWANIKATLKTYFDSLYAATGRGLPSGGTTGQVLVKTSGTDYAVGWDDQSGGGGGQPVPTTSPLPVGVLAHLLIRATGVVADGATIAGSSLYVILVEATSTGGTPAISTKAGGQQAGTWMNVSGVSIGNAGSNLSIRGGYFVRVS